MWDYWKHRVTSGILYHTYQAGWSRYTRPFPRDPESISLYTCSLLYMQETSNCDMLFGR